jgi:hypothetical protein
VRPASAGGPAAAGVSVDEVLPPSVAPGGVPVVVLVAPVPSVAGAGEVPWVTSMTLDRGTLAEPMWTSGSALAEPPNDAEVTTPLWVTPFAST